LGIGVSEEHTKEVSLLFSLNQNKWVYSLDLFTTYAIIVRAVLTFGPHSPCAFSELKLSDSLSKNKKSLRRKLEVNLDVLVHENKGRMIGVDINV